MGVDTLAKALRQKSQIPGFCWHLFAQLRSSPSFSPSRKSVDSTVRILTQARMLPELDHLQQLFLRLPANAAQLSLASLSSYSAKSGLLEKAISQFQSLRTHFPSLPPSIHLYNTLLEASLKQNRTDLISYLYKDLALCRVSPDTYTFNILIASLCEFGCLGEARQLFDKMHLKSCKPNAFSFGILARGYCSVGQSLKALELVGCMGTFTCSPNHVIYNTLVTGFCKEGKIDEAEKLVDRMRSEGIFPNIVTFNSRISALCKSGKVSEGAEIFRDMEEGDGKELPKPNLTTYNVLLDGFCKSGMLEEAENLVQAMKKGGIFNTLETYNIWLSALVRSGKMLEARAMLNEMVENGVESNIYSYNIVIDGLCKAGMVSDARNVMDTMRGHEILPDVITYSTLIHGLCIKGNISEANRILEEMIACGCSPNTVTCNILLQSLWRQGKDLEAKKLLWKMNERGYGLDIVTCNIVINGLCKNGEVDKAIEILSQMWVHGSAALRYLGNPFLGLVDCSTDGKSCLPDIVSYSTIIDALCQAGRFEEAKKKFLEMMEKNIAPDSVIYEIFLHAFCKDGKLSSAFRVLSDMEKNCKPRSKSYCFLIRGLQRKNQVDEIDDLIDEMHKRGIVPDVFLYNSLINCLSERGKNRDAALLLEEMLQRGIIPNVSSFSLLIKGFCKDRDFESAYEVFETSLTVLGQKKSLCNLMFDELVSGGELMKAKKLIEDAMEKAVRLEWFSYRQLIEGLCEKDHLEEALNILSKLINRGCLFDPATFMPVIEGLRKSGRKHEGDKLTDIMMDTAMRCDNLKHKFSRPWEIGALKRAPYHESYHERDAKYRRLKEEFHANDWQTILHRDDGTGLAMKVLKRVQKGWGQGSIPILKLEKKSSLDEWDGFS